MADAEIPLPLLDALRRLEALLGMTATPDFADGHVRWDLYRNAIEVPESLPVLLSAVSVEPDAALASGVVGAVLERVAPQERNAWVEALDASVRDFSARRVKELDALETIRSGSFPATQIPDVIDNWSNWLQLRAIAACDDKEILKMFSELGRTKRIRRTALESLK
jgi:hypothetical protein